MGTDYEVMVMGGGCAGLCAAIQAGRRLGAGRVCLVEKNGVCGGTTTAGGIGYPGLFHIWGRQVIAGVGWELVERTRAEMGVPAQDMSGSRMVEHWRYHVRVDPVLFAALADEELTRSGVEVRLHTMVGDVRRGGDGRWRVTLCGKDGLFGASCRELVDCTGDANVCHILGLPLREPSTCQPGTYSVILSGYDPDALDYAAIGRAFAAALAEGRLQPGDLGWHGGFSPNFLRARGNNANHIPGIVAADSEGRTRMELAGRAAVLRAYRFLRAQPGLKHLTMQFGGGECGVRETRTVVGEWTVTGEEYVAGVRYADALCHSVYPIDLHVAGAAGIEQRRLAEGVVPFVPRGALVPRGTDHLLVAGRCLSSDRLANSALRVQATCMATGQAAGAMAALAAETGVTPLRLPLADIRALLAANGLVCG